MHDSPEDELAQGEHKTSDHELLPNFIKLHPPWRLHPLHYKPNELPLVRNRPECQQRLYNSNQPEKKGRFVHQEDHGPLGIPSKNFMWGWNNLSQAASTSPSHKALLVRSRMMLALRYNADTLELVKLTSYIPNNSKCRISPTYLPFTANDFSRRGLEVAANTIRLIATISPAPFGINSINLLIPAMAYIVAHAKAFKPPSDIGNPLLRSLAHAMAILRKGKQASHLANPASTYLKLFKFLINYHQISPPHPG
ncbi:hypothetical protein DSO57_1038780 [Entomophthora muscae]|uniref:Uncharacterized protein n=1 Tax=Entomophthora muscae TaxID=34485 RepID=A0ACC2T9Z9_9FUNG|nr:hypothetical protein DSO57_1038780 [Entomophthora muscae]